VTPEKRDDDLERRLRDVLHDRALGLPVEADAVDRVHAGARRRQRRRNAASSASVVAIIAIAAAGIALRPHNHAAVTTAASQTPTVTRSAETSPSSAASAPAIASSAPASTAPSSPATTFFAPNIAAAQTIPLGGRPPTGFVPISVTAVSDARYWVLGHAPCGVDTCTAIAKTVDGGKSFTEIGAPASAVVPDVPGNIDVFGVNTISDIRFVDSLNGWAYGGGLWQTTDGGTTWNAVPQIGLPVERLAVASGHVWAIVLAFGAAGGVGPAYDLYTTTYPNGSWTKVDSAGSFGPALPVLAVHNASVTVIGTDASTGVAKAVAATGGASTFTSLPSPPCNGGPGDPAAETPSGGLWLACSSATNNVGRVVYSPDFGKSFSVVSSVGAQAIGAVDDATAIIASNGKLTLLKTDKSTSAVSYPAIPASTVWDFIGFTDPTGGFAIPEVNGARQLWRTTDGGSHWTVVGF
jgi:hypothetical protein